MKLANFVDDPKKMKVLKWVVYFIIALIIVFDIVVHIYSGYFYPSNWKDHFFGDKIWAFWSLFGFICCVLMVLFVKGLAGAFLSKKENFYD